MVGGIVFALFFILKKNTKQKKKPHKQANKKHTQKLNKQYFEDEE